MKPNDQKHFDQLYQRHVRALKLRGYAASTIDVYARAVRRLVAYFDCLPDQIDREQLEIYFAELVESHSWATVRVDRNGLQFFWQHVLKRDWDWVEIIKPPQVRTLPDVLTVGEVEQLIAAARKLRYRVFILATYSMGLRLSETLSLQVGDVDAERGRVHIRRGKGHRDRLVPLPDLTCQALRALWAKHRHPRLLFPNAVGSPDRIRTATTPMNRGGTQKAVKVLLAECGIKKRSPFTPCATALPLTCWNRA
jgi:integrase